MPRKPKPSGRGYQPRPVDVREPLLRFLIVCEGKKTEPNYFDGFRVPSVRIEIVGLGKDPLALVEHALKLRRQEQYDQVWCVFDRDDVSAERFNKALDLARQNKQHNIKVAYSNQAFELWYLLHFHYCDVPQSRSDYCKRLSHELKRPYKKEDPTLYQELLPRQKVAIDHAKLLLAQYKPTNPADDDPATTVHKLVQELNKFVQDKRL